MEMVNKRHVDSPCIDMVAMATTQDANTFLMQNHARQPFNLDRNVGNVWIYYVVFFLEIIAFGTCVNVYFTDWEGTGHDKRRQGFMGVPLDWKVAPNISEYLANLQLRHKTERRWVELRYKGSSSVYLTTDTPKSAASCSSSRADVVTLSIGSCQNWRRCAACASATSRATGAFSGASKPPAIQSENLIHTRG